jgi:soluble lytic murein transglycosylase
MPRLPDKNSLGEPAVPRSTRGVATYRPGIEAEGYAQLGETVSKMGAELTENQDKFDLARAKSHFLQKSIELQDTLKTDPDYSTYGERYNKGIGEIKNEALQMVRDTNARSLLDYDLSVDATRGVSALNEIAKKKEVDFGRATTLELLNKNNTAYLAATDEPTRAALLNANNQLLAGSGPRGKNYYSAEEEVKLRQSNTDDILTAQAQQMVIEGKGNEVLQKLTFKKPSGGSAPSIAGPEKNDADSV